MTTHDVFQYQGRAEPVLVPIGADWFQPASQPVRARQQTPGVVVYSPLPPTPWDWFTAAQQPVRQRLPGQDGATTFCPLPVVAFDWLRETQQPLRPTLRDAGTFVALSPNPVVAFDWSVEYPQPVRSRRPSEYPSLTFVELVIPVLTYWADPTYPAIMPGPRRGQQLSEVWRPIDTTPAPAPSLDWLRETQQPVRRIQMTDLALLEIVGWEIPVAIFVHEPVCFSTVFCYGVAFAAQFDAGTSNMQRLDSGFAAVSELEGERYMP